jgi:hypothetical protein
MKFKKAELTTKQIVGLIILITSFAVILFFIFSLNLGETNNKEICHNSVVLASKNKFGASLDCRTNYVCISAGGKCESFDSDETIKVELGDNEYENKNNVMKAIAEEMSDCWWMFGEGEVDYIGYNWKLDIAVGTHCGICSVVEFDSVLKEKYSEGLISYPSFYYFLQTEKKDKAQTYLRYLYGVEDITFIEDKIKEESGIDLKKIENKDMISLEGRHLILTGIKGEEEFVYPYFVKQGSEIICKNFITKA